jgi:hypothetical protein
MCSCFVDCYLISTVGRIWFGCNWTFDSAAFVWIETIYMIVTRTRIIRPEVLGIRIDLHFKAILSERQTLR